MVNLAADDIIGLASDGIRVWDFEMHHVASRLDLAGELIRIANGALG